MEYAWEYHPTDSDEFRRDAEYSAALEDVGTEMRKQHRKWGEQNHPDGTGKPRYAEKAIVAKANCDAAHDAGFTAWDLILLEEVYEALEEKDPVKLRAELIQVAAVAAQWVAAIDRRGSNG